MGPFAGDRLDKALGFAVGLRSVRFGEVMLEAESEAGCGKVPGAIGRTAIGEDALDVDAMSLVEVEGLVESVEDVCDLFVREKAGEAESGMIVDGDEETFDAGVAIAHRAIAGGTDAGAREAAQLLDVEVKEFARVIAFVADDWRFWRFEGREAVETVAAQNAREGCFGDWQKREDLSVGAALTTQFEDAGFELATGFARLMVRDRRAILQARRKAGLPGTSEPAADGSVADGVSESDGSAGEFLRGEKKSNFGSHQRGQSGISVHVVRAGLREVEFSSTTSLPDLSRADNVLKHDT
jgi:hypothetical protein